MVSPLRDPGEYGAGLSSPSPRAHERMCALLCVSLWLHVCEYVLLCVCVDAWVCVRVLLSVCG